jgi:hypothetical protein
MRTIRTKVYLFNELSEESQQNAIEKEKNNLEIFLDSFNENAIDKITEHGFYDDIKIQYSLSYSQGDGFSFSCKRIKSNILLDFFIEILGKDKEKTAKIIIENCNFECNGNKSNYCYASAFDIDYYTNSHCPNVDEIIKKVCTKLEIYYLNLCKDLEKQGYEELEFQYLDSTIKENLIANNYEFTKDGNLFNS